MNSIITNNFQMLIENLFSEKPSNYSFKINSFKKTIDIINNLDFEINNIEQLKNTKGIGKGTLERISEIIKSGKLKENINNTNTNISEFKLLQTITGIGPAKATNLIKSNITFNDLINNPSEESLKQLTHHQLLGIKYYHDLNKKIPRDIITSFISLLNKIKKKINFSFTVCGSYRREKDLSSDIDVLILEENHNLNSIIKLLKNKNILVDDLTTKGNTKYMGICKLPNFPQFMRIDIRLIPSNSYPFAILYFTGSKQTNTYMRNQAIKLNLKLNEYGLFDKDNNHIFLKSEKDIFNYLNIEYKHPNQR